MFNLSNILKEAKWIGKISLLQEMQMKNMVGQLFAKHKDKIAPENVNKEKEKFLNFANKINDKVVKNLKVDFKNEKIVLVWILEQIFLNVIDEDKLQEDLEVIKENLEIYFKNKGVINKPLEKINYSELKDLVQDHKKGGEEAEHQEFLSKPLYEGNSYKIYKITEVDQCIKIGKGTSWCIQGEEYAEYYLKKGPLYLITKNDKRFGLLSFETTQFMDVNDNRLPKEKLKEIFDVIPKEVFEKLISISIKKDSDLIQYINEPSEKMQLEVVKNKGIAIGFIKDPSEDVQLEAVKQDSNAIHLIRKPSKLVQLEAVKQNGFAIRFIENPSEQVKMVAIRENPQVLRYFKNLDEELQLVAVKIDGSAIKHIENPSKEVQLAAVNVLGSSIRHIKNPDEEVQLAAVKRDLEAINYFEPTQKVKEYVESQK